jgi:ribosomal protein S27E
MTTTRMEGLSQEQYNKIDSATKLILELLQGTTTLGPRQIPMPREGGSITPIQAHVTKTRLGFGSQRKKRKMNHEEQGVQEEALVHLPRPSGSKVPKRRQLFVQKKRTRMRLPKLCKEACPSCGDLSIFFKGITNTECKNCQYIIVREGGSVALDKEGSEIDQDVELFFKDLDIY